MEQSSKARRLPQVDKLLRHPLLLDDSTRLRRQILVALTRRHLDSLRSRLRSSGDVPDSDSIARDIHDQVEALLSPFMRRVINATGVVLNTNLGRAPLSAEAAGRIADLAGGYTNLEIDLDSGKRGKRGERLDLLLSLLTGCESSLVVNNNAAAVLLVVNTLAAGREVLVSRGELIEIGGSFRLPEIVSASGARLQEVGTTNRTRIEDYRAAAGESTGLILRCHRSNFTISGFVEETPVSSLVALAEETGIPLVEDLGSGVLLRLEGTGLVGEPTVGEVLESGCRLVTFSGDKLLGGPQAGIVVGDGELVARLKRNPIYRAVRPDKLALCALEATLTHYLTPAAQDRVPVLRMFTTPAAELRRRAESLVARANPQMELVKLEVIRTDSTAGGGSLPGQTVESYGIALLSDTAPDKLAGLLRQSPLPVIAFIHEHRVMLDLRTIDEADEDSLVATLLSLDRALGPT